MSLHPVQDLIKARLATVAYLSSPTLVPMFMDDEGDLETKITNALGVLDGGLAILILTPHAGRNVDSNPKARVEWSIAVSAVENPIINRGTGGLNKTAFNAIKAVAKGLHWWIPGSLIGRMTLSEIDSDTNENGDIAYLAQFKFDENL